MKDKLIPFTKLLTNENCFFFFLLKNNCLFIEEIL